MFSLLIALPLLVTAAVHDVQVGKDGLAFSPEALSADVGDQVVFHFVAKNHTATQSSFADPCGPLDGGFDSGFNPVPAGSTDFPTFTYTVTGTSPVWVYCKQAANTAASHCGAGMVFAVNCPTEPDAKNSFTNFKSSAMAIGQQLQAEAASSSAASTATESAAQYGATDAPSDPQEVTATITLDSSTWTTSYTSYPNSPDATPASVAGQVHIVTVGGNAALAFDPPHITASPRDIISFQFVSKNHTATQSSFASPCRKLASTSTTQQVGFDSGFMFVGNSTTPLVWNVTVNDTAPIWVYCRQTAPVDHCGAGMVFAVNSDETSTSQKTFSVFQAAAKAQNGSVTNSSAPSGSGSSATGNGSGAGTGSAVPTRAGAALVAGIVGVVGTLLL